MKKKMLLIPLLIGLMSISTVYGAYLTYKAYVEIYGYKYPLGQVELETWGLPDIEGLEAREDYIGEMRVYTYSPDAQLVLQLVQLSHVVTNFRSFTVKVCYPLDMVFVVDLTGSMQPYMETVKAKLIELMWLLRSMHKCDVQVGVVGFKDDPVDTINCSLTDNLAAVQGFIEGLGAETGGPIPQSHYLGFETALELFNEKPESWVSDRVVVFVSDAEPGVDNVFEFEPDGPTVRSVLALAEAGIKVHAVLCGPDEPPESLIYRWYADVTGGHFVPPVWDPDFEWMMFRGFWMPYRIIPVVTSNPTWIVKLTPVTPFDSFQLPLPTSPPCEKKGYYRFEIYVDFFAKAIPWHEYFTVELTAHLEKSEPKPEFPPPEFPPEEELEIVILMGIRPLGDQKVCTYPTFWWEIREDPPDRTIPLNVTLFLDGDVLYVGKTFPEDFNGEYNKWHAEEPNGYKATTKYFYEYLGEVYYALAEHSFNVVD